MTLVTGHRRENICHAWARINQESNVQIVYPMHLTPDVQTPVRRIPGAQSGVHLIAPQDYPPFVRLMNHAISSSSTAAAASLGKPVLAMRLLTNPRARAELIRTTRLRNDARPDWALDKPAVMDVLPANRPLVDAVGL